MNVSSSGRIRGGLAIVLVCSSLTIARAQTATARIVSAANTFLATLDAGQRHKVLFAWNDEQQRANWANFPVSFVPRGGISLQDKTPVPLCAAMAVVACALTQRG